MPKQPTSIRLSPATQQQISELSEHGNLSEVISKAVLLMHVLYVIRKEEEQIDKKSSDAMR